MTKEFFAKQVDRLRNVYSTSALSNERVEIIWATFKQVPNDTFEAALNFLIGEFTTQALPSVSRIHEAVTRFRVEQKQQFGGGNNHPPCRLCHRNGFVNTRTRSLPRYEVLFKCPCPAGVEFKARAQIWDMARHFDHYELLEPHGEPYSGTEDNPRAKELAAKYGPSIQAMLRNAFPKLPYNPNQRGEIPGYEEPA